MATKRVSSKRVPLKGKPNPGSRRSAKTRTKMSGKFSQKPRQEMIDNFRAQRTEAIASVGTYEMDGKKGDIFWSDEFYRLHGLKPQSVKPSTDRRLSMVHPDDRESLQLAFDQALKSGKPFSIEKRIMLAKGEVKWVLSRGEVQIKKGSSNRSMFGVLIDITRQKLAELEKLNLEERLRKAQAIASVGNWEMTGNFSEIYWSDEFYRIHGLQPQSVKPSVKLRLSMVHPKDRAKLQQAIDGAVRDGKAYSMEKRIIQPGGQIRWVLSQGEASIDPVTGKRKVFGTILDITDRKQQELRNNEIENNLRKAQAIAALGSWELVGEDEEVSWSDEFYRIHGLQPQSVKPSTKLRLAMVHPEDREKLKKAIDKATKSGKPFSLEKRIITPDGKLRYILSKGEVTIDEWTGKRRVFGTLLDITSQKEAEKKIEAGERLTKLLIEHSGEGIMFGKPDGTILSANPEACRLLQRTEDELCSIGQSGIIDMMDPVNSAALPRRVREGKISGVFKFIRKDGSTFFSELTATIFKNPDGEKNSTIIFRDVSERRNAEAVRVELLNRLERVADQTPGFVYQFRVRKDGTRHFPYASAGIKKIYGLTPEQVQDNSAITLQIIHPDDREMVLETVKHSAETLTDWEAEYRVNLPQGNTIWVAGNARPQREADGSTMWHGYIQDVTARKMKELELEENRQFLANLIDHLPGYVYRVNNDPDYTPLYISETVQSVTGYRQDEYLVDKTISRGKEILPDDAGWVWDEVQKALNEKSSYECEYRIITKQGMERWVWEKGKGVFDETGRLKCLEGFVSDITTRKKAQLALVERDTQYKLLANNKHSTDIVSLLAIGGAATYVSPSVKRVLGYEVEEMTGFDRFEFIHPDDVERVRSCFSKVAEGMPVENCQYQIRTADNRYIWLESNASPVYEDGRITAVQMSSREVTARKLAEVRLRESENDLRAVLDSSLDNTVFIDWNGVVRVVNVSARLSVAKIFNKAIEPGVTFRDLLPEGLAIEFQTNFDRALSGEQLDFEREVKITDEKAMWLHVRYIPVKNDDGKIIGAVQNSVDITARKLAEIKLEQSEYDLRAILDASSDSTAFVDKNGNVRVVNKQERERIRLCYDGVVLGSPFIDMLPPLSREEYKKHFQLALQGEVVRFEKEEQVQQEARWIRASYLPVYDSEHSIIGVSQNITDITEPKLAEIALQKSEAKLRAFFKGTTDSIILIDLDSRIIGFNQSAAEATQELYGKEIVIGQNYLDYVLLQTARDDIRRAKEGHTIHNEIEENFPSGHRLWFKRKYQTMNDSDGNIIGVAIVLTNIDVEKRSQLRLINLTDNIPDGVILEYWVGNNWEEHKFTYISQGCLKLFGLTQEQVLADRAAVINLIHEADRPGFIQAKRSAYKTLEPFEIDFRVVLHSGQQKWLKGKYKPTKAADNSTLFEAILVDVTRQQEAAILLEKSEAKLNAFFQSTTDSVLLIDKELNIMAFNAVAQQNVRQVYNKDLHEGLSMLGFIVPGHEQGFKQNFERALAGERISKELEIPFVNSAKRWMRFMYFPIRVNNGDIIGIAFNTTDIDKEKRATQRITSLTDNIPDGLIFEFVANADGTLPRFTYVSQGAGRMFETEPEQLMGDIRSAISLIHPDDKKMVFQLVTRSVTTLKPLEFDFRVLTPSGKVKWLRTRSLPSMNSAGEVVIEGINLDVTHQKELELEQAASRFKLQNTLDNLISGVAVTDSNGKFTYINKSGLEILADLKHELLDQPFTISNEVRLDLNALTLPAEKSIIGYVLSNREPVSNYQYGLRKKDNSIVWLNANSAPLLDEQGNLYGVVASFIDITETLNNRRKIEDSENDLRAVLNASTDSTFFMDREGRVRVANEKGVRNLQRLFNRELQVGELFINYVPESSQLKFQSNFQQALNGKRVHLEVNLSISDIGNLWLDVKYLPVLDREGNIIGVSFSAHDISQRKISEKEKLKSIDQMRFAGQLAHIGEWELDLETMIPRWSDEVCRIHEVENGFAPSIDVAINFYAEDSRPVISTAVKRCIETGEWYDLKLQIITRSGRTKWIRTVGVSERQNNKAVKLYGLFQDINESVLREEALRQSEANLKTVFDHTVIGYILCDVGGVIKSFNAVAASYISEVTGKSFSVGDNFPTLFEPPPQHTPGSIVAWVLGGSTVEYDRPLTTISGTWKWFHVKYSPVFDREQVISILISVSDITAQKESQIQIQKQADEIRIKSDQLNGIASNIPKGAIYQLLSKPDGELTIPYISEGIMSMIGRSAEQVISNPKNLFGIIHPDDLPKFISAVSQSARDLSIFNYSCRFETGEQCYSWFTSHAKPSRMDNGTVLFDGVMIDETEKFIAQLEQQQLTERLQLATKAASIGIWEWDLQTNQIAWDHNFKKIFGDSGLPLEERYDFFFDHLHPEDRPLVEAAIQRAIDLKTTYEALYRWQRHDGKWIHVQAHGLVRFAETGKPISMTGLVVDVTERKKAELAVLESEQRFKILANEVPVGVLLQDRNDKVMFSNAAALALLGVSEDQLSGKSSFDPDWRVVHEDGSPFLPDDRPSVKALKTNRSVSNVPMGVFRPANKDWVWLLSSATPQLDTNGNADQVIVSLVDVTREKENLRELEKLSLIARHTDNLVVITDAFRKIEWVNEPFVKLTGYTLDEVVGKNPREFLQGPETDSSINDVVRDRLNNQAAVNFEIVNYSKTGEKYWLDIGIQPVFNDHGVLTNFIAIELNISERKKSEQALRASEELLRKLSENIPNGALYQLGVENGLRTLKWISAGIDSILGITAEEILFDNSLFFNQIHPDDLHLLRRDDISEFESDMLIDREIRMVHRDGGIHWVNLRSKPRRVNNEIIRDGFLFDVTPRRKAEEAARQSRETLEVITNNLPSVAVYQFEVRAGERSGQYKYFSSGLESITGIKPDELIKDSSLFEQQIHPDDLAKDQPVHADIGSSDSRREYRFKHLNGEWRWLRIRSYPTKLPDGSIVWNGLIIDITDQRKSDEALQKSQMRMRAIFDNAINAIILSDDSGRYIDGNRAACRMLGYTHEEFIHLSIEQVVTPESSHSEFFQNFLNHGEHSGVVRLLGKNGQVRSVRYNAVANILPGTHLSVLEDITEMLKTEQVVQQQADELKHNAEQILTIAQNLPNGSIYELLIKPDGSLHMPFFSEGLARRLGTTAAAIMNDIQAFNARCHPDDVPLINQTVYKSADDLSDFRQRVGRFKDEDGKYHYLGWYARPTRLNDGSTLWRGVVMDETEQVEAERNLLVTRFTIDRASDAVFWVRSDGSFADINPAAHNSLGYTYEEMIRLSVPEIDPGFSAEKYSLHWDELRDKKSMVLQSKHRRKDGKVIDVEINANHSEFEGQEFNCAIVRDITERKKAQDEIIKTNRLYSVTSEINDMVVHVRNKDDVFRQACRIAVEQGQFRMAWIGKFNKETLTIRPAHWFGHEEGYLKYFEEISLENQRFTNGPTVRSIKENRPIICDHIAAEENNDLWRTQAVKRGYGSSIAFPIMEGDEIVGVFNLYHAEPYFFTKKEISLLQHITSNIGFSLTTIENDIIRMRKEQALTESEERLRSIFENEPNCIKVINHKGELVQMNASGLAMIEAESLDHVRGGKVADLVDPGFRKQFMDLTSSVIGGGAGKLEFSITGLKGGKRWLETHAIPLKDTISKRNVLLGITRDVTAERQAQQDLLQAKNRLELAAQAAELGIWDADLQTGKIVWDEGMAKIYGVTVTEEPLTKQYWAQFVHPDDLPNLDKEDREMILGNVSIYKYGFRIIRKDTGEVRYVETLGVIERNRDGKALRMTGVNMDRTNERTYEQQLLNGLKEKEVLVKEIHHRVKNNLQLISSILYIKSIGAKEANLKNFLEDTRQKIRAIALIHERLLQAGSVNVIDVADYLKKLIRDLQMSNFREGLDISFQSDIESEMMTLDVAVNCGMIVNELVTNSIKHGYPGQIKGTISVSLRKTNDGHELIVSDDGVSIPEGIAPGDTNSFGMQLLDIFIRQLGGVFELDRRHGTTSIIKFK